MTRILWRSVIVLLFVLAGLAFVIYSREVWLAGVTHGQMACLGVAPVPTVPRSLLVNRDSGWTWGDAGRVQEHPLVPRPTVVRSADPRPWERWTGRPAFGPGRDGRDR